MDEFKELLYRLGLSLADLVAFLVRVRDSVIWQGRLVDAVLLADTTSVTVPHGLGRAHKGGVVVTASYAVPAFVLEAQTTKSDSTITLYVDTVAPVDVAYRLWVF